MPNMMIKTKIQQWRWRRWWRWWYCPRYAHASDAAGEKSPVAASLSLSSCFKIIPVALRRASREDVQLFWEWFFWPGDTISSSKYFSRLKIRCTMDKWWKDTNIVTCSCHVENIKVISILGSGSISDDSMSAMAMVLSSKTATKRWWSDAVVGVLHKAQHELMSTCQIFQNCNLGRKRFGEDSSEDGDIGFDLDQLDGQLGDGVQGGADHLHHPHWICL